MTMPVLYFYRRIRRRSEKSTVISADQLTPDTDSVLVEEKEMEQILEEAAAEAQQQEKEELPELVGAMRSEQEERSTYKPEERAQAVIDEALSKKPPPPVRPEVQPEKSLEPIHEFKEEVPIAQHKLKPLDYDPDEYLSLGRAVSASVQKGHEFVAENKLDPATRSYQTALALKADCLEACLGLGYISFMREQWVMAMGFYKKALSISPESADAHYGVGRICMETGREDQAVPSLRKALQIDPSFNDARDALTNLGKAA